MSKKIKLLLLSLGLTFIMTGCGAASDYEDGYSSGITANMDSVVSNSATGFWGSMTDSATKEEFAVVEKVEAPSVQKPESEIEEKEFQNDKLVYTSNLRLQTLEYDECVKSIRDNIKKYNGFIEQESEYDNAHRWYYDDYVKTSGTKTLELTIRIPSSKYEDFLAAAEGSGKVISRTAYVENISKQYYETDTYIKSLEIQQERLLSMMEQATTIEDMITVEGRLSDIQYQLNSAKTKLSSMDADVAYSTINIEIEEVMEYTYEEPIQKKNTFFDRLKNTISDAWYSFWGILEGLLFFVIRAIPVAVIAAPFVIIIGVLYKKKKAKK